MTFDEFKNPPSEEKEKIPGAFEGDLDNWEKVESMDEMWHRIREEQAAEDAGLSVEELVARDNALAKEAAERLGLKIVTAADFKKPK